MHRTTYFHNQLVSGLSEGLVEYTVLALDNWADLWSTTHRKNVCVIEQLDGLHLNVTKCLRSWDVLLKSAWKKTFFCLIVNDSSMLSLFLYLTSEFFIKMSKLDLPATSPIMLILSLLKLRPSLQSAQAFIRICLYPINNRFYILFFFDNLFYLDLSIWKKLLFIVTLKVLLFLTWQLPNTKFNVWDIEKTERDPMQWPI